MTRPAPIRRLALPLAFAAAGLLAVPVAAQAEALAGSVAAMDPSIRNIGIFPAGERDGARWFYRVVVASALPTDRLFVQSIRIGADGNPNLGWTSEVRELADLKLRVASVRGEIEADGLTAFVEIANPAADGAATYELLVEPDGTYRFGPASN